MAGEHLLPFSRAPPESVEAAVQSVAEARAGGVPASCNFPAYNHPVVEAYAIPEQALTEAVQKLLEAQTFGSSMEVLEGTEPSVVHSGAPPKVRLRGPSPTPALCRPQAHACSLSAVGVRVLNEEDALF